jgi:hypothetical protein
MCSNEARLVPEVIRYATPKAECDMYEVASPVEMVENLFDMDANSRMTCLRPVVRMAAKHLQTSS